MKWEFENKLTEYGFPYQCYHDDFYILHQNNDVIRTIKVRLICSEPVGESALDSRNGNVVQSFGHFKLRLTTEVKEQDFFILAFENTTNKVVEFIIIPSKELKRRLIKKNRVSKASHKISIVFWLMDDRFLYDCTNIGIEGEWYYLSKGLNRRMVDGTEWDYSEFLNDWNRLTMK